MNCSGLVKVTMSDSVTYLGKGAFYKCINLNDIALSNSLSKIESLTFQSCFKLSKVTIPNNVVSLGEAAFRYCKSLEYVTIPNNIQTIENSAFDGCNTGLSFYVTESSVVKLYANEKGYAINEIELASNALKLNVGKTATISFNSEALCTWKSSNISVATIDANGKITAMKKGTIIITAVLYGKEYNCNITVVSNSNIKIDEIHFPDKYFREYVKVYDKDSNGVLSDSELKKVTTMYFDLNEVEPKTMKVLYGKITSFEGIQYFTYLNNLTVLTMNVEALELSNKSLEKVYVRDCKLSKFDVSGCDNLKELRIEYVEISGLDVSKNSQLQKLICTNSKLKKLDLKSNSKLQVLDCSYNNIKKLDLTGNKLLLEVNCCSCQLSEILVGSCTKLTKFLCADNLLSNVDISNNLNLETLFINNNKIQSLNTTKNSLLSDLECNNNKIKNLDLSNNSNLIILTCSSNEIRNLDVSNLTKVKVLEYDEDVIIIK